MARVKRARTRACERANGRMSAKRSTGLRLAFRLAIFLRGLYRALRVPGEETKTTRSPFREGHDQTGAREIERPRSKRATAARRFPATASSRRLLSSRVKAPRGASARDARSKHVSHPHSTRSRLRECAARARELIGRACAPGAPRESECGENVRAFNPLGSLAHLARAEEGS